MSSRRPSIAHEPSLVELARWCDVLMVAVRAHDDTRGLIDREIIEAVGPNGTLINITRGFVVDEDALIAALKDGRLGQAGLDVFEPEPPAHHPLFDHPSVTLTPHLMGLTRRGTELTFADAAQGVVDVLAGRRPVAVANPDWSSAPGIPASA